MQIREYHRKHPAARVVDANEEYEELLKEEPRIEFRGEVSLSLSLTLTYVCLLFGLVFLPFLTIIDCDLISGSLWTLLGSS